MAEHSKRESRRKFLKAVPAAMAGAVGAKVLAQAPQPNGGPVNVEAIECAEKLLGIDLHSDEEDGNCRLAEQPASDVSAAQRESRSAGHRSGHHVQAVAPGEGTEGTGDAGRGDPLHESAAHAETAREPRGGRVLAGCEAGQPVERRLVTSTELTRMYLDRLKRYQPTLNFYVTLTEDLAVKQAADADREIEAGKYRGPLHGLPWGAKDLFATKGIVTSWGGEPYVEQVFDYDATIVERLRDAGAVLVAKLTLGALAQGDRWFGGRTNSPWNPQRGSSGSSAGPGSATAAGCVAFSIGTETRGSIISPSTANGVVGLRPTYGRVSRYGAMALSNTMDKVGPMCRYVEDCVLVLNAIYGPDKRDGTVADAAFRWNPDAPLAGYKIAFVRNGFDPAPADGRGRARRRRGLRQREPAGVAQPVARRAAVAAPRPVGAAAGCPSRIAARSIRRC